MSRLFFKKNVWRIVTGLLIIFFVADPRFVSALTPQEELQKAINDKANELQKINGQILDNQKGLLETNQKSKTLNQQVKKLDTQISFLNLNIKFSGVQIEKLKLELQNLSYDIEAKEQDLDGKKVAITRFVREYQARQNENLLAIFLKNQSLTESIFQSQTLSTINADLAKSVDELMSVKKDLEAKLGQAAEKKTAVEVQSENLKNQRVIVQDQQQGKKDLLDQTKNQEKAYQRIISDLEKKQTDINDQIDTIENQLRANFNVNLLPTKRPGVFKKPVDGRLTQEYGKISYLYHGKPHNGIDWGAPVGTPITAARDGVVLAVGNNGRYQYGKYVVIKHDNGFNTLYAHMSRQAAHEGDTVKAGDVIGYVGETGYAFGAHLHFGLYWGDSFYIKNIPGCNCGLVPYGVTINPADYMDLPL